MDALSAYTSELKKTFADLSLTQAAFAARDDVPWERTRVNRFLSGKDNTIASRSFIDCLANVGSQLGKPLSADRREHLLALRRAALRERATAVGLLEVIDEEFHLVRVQMSNSREEIEVYRHIKDSLLLEVREYRCLLENMEARNAEQQQALQVAALYLAAAESRLQHAEQQRETLLAVIDHLQDHLREVRRSAQAWDGLSQHAGWFVPLVTGVLLSSPTWSTAGLGLVAFATSGGLGSPVSRSTENSVTNDYHYGSMMGPYTVGSFHGSSTTVSTTQSTHIDFVAILGWALFIFSVVMLVTHHLWVWPVIVAYVVFEVLSRARLGPPQARYVLRTLTGLVPGSLLLLAAYQLGTDKGVGGVFTMDQTAWTATGAYACIYLVYAIIRLVLARNRLRQPARPQLPPKTS
ncbi:hypothetical protein [Streptomyces coeruleorubidus]|uniref:hypothetical protein n=1 Tax=Streptomyces coeruleorubidus TaxID=116188 RepID=UPI0033B336C0